eukprot:TRINITY_DN1753_c0_g1_i1.p1 TRINITY_DN1753_c0_g1~~TRINITY_DN1753_c0_g1_i1.p1  ORF type:complete len:250 (+),score=15.15 TRINITY_DN1753_c0_g1_i1:108-752(+)
MSADNTTTIQATITLTSSPSFSSPLNTSTYAPGAADLPLLVPLAPYSQLVSTDAIVGVLVAAVIALCIGCCFRYQWFVPQQPMFFLDAETLAQGSVPQPQCGFSQVRDRCSGAHGAKYVWLRAAQAIRHATAGSLLSTSTRCVSTVQRLHTSARVVALLQTYTHLPCGGRIRSNEAVPERLGWSGGTSRARCPTRTAQRHRPRRRPSLQPPSGV